MIHINLHDYRDELRKIEIQKHVVKAASVVGVVVILVIANWLVEQVQLDKVRAETQKLEKAVQALDGEVKRIQQIQSSWARKEQIVAGIDKLRGNQFPVSKMINDLNMAVPEGLWLTSLSQMSQEKIKKKKIPIILFGDPSKKEKKKRKKKKGKEEEAAVNEFVEISGQALNEQLIAEYIKKLQEISYYKLTFLHKSRQTILAGYPIYTFTAYTYMPVETEKK